MYTQVMRAFLKLISTVAAVMVMTDNKVIRERLARAIAEATSAASDAIKEQ